MKKKTPATRVSRTKKVKRAARQRRFPKAQRIADPAAFELQPALVVYSATPGDEVKLQPSAPNRREEPGADTKPLVELAKCLWYLKTKFFRREWANLDTTDEDPRVRNALRQFNKATEAMTACGLELRDPKNERYPAGGEGLMRPMQHEPRDGIAFDIVSETITPILYRHDRLVHRGEVIVAVPRLPTPDAPPAGPPTPPATGAVP